MLSSPARSWTSHSHLRWLALSPSLEFSFAFDLLADSRDPEGARRAIAALAACNGLVCDAAVVAAAAVAFGMRDDAIINLPWGVDLDRFPDGNVDGRARIRAELGWPAGLRVALVTRSHEPLYHMPIVIEAFLMAARREPRLRLLVLGDGSERRLLEARVAEAGLMSRVAFVGRIDTRSLPDWYAAADCYVSASPVDGSSVSLLEAMAAGLPVVVPAVGGNPEWVIPGETGWLVPADDPSATATALLSAASLSSLERQRVARAARAVIVERADWQRNGARFADFVAACAGAHSV